SMKTELLANPLFARQAEALWMEIDNALGSELEARTEAIEEALKGGFHALARWLAEDPERQNRLNRWIRLMALRVLLPRRVEIGAYVTRVVQNWDSATLVNRLELQVGKDLQYIRINGTLVGGLVGLLIFIASKWLG